MVTFAHEMSTAVYNANQGLFFRKKVHNLGIPSGSLNW